MKLLDSTLGMQKTSTASLWFPVRNPAGAAVLLCCALLWLAGCNVLRTYDAVQMSPADWYMFGGNVERMSATDHEVRPPLKEVWEYDTNGGFAKYSAAVVDSLVVVGSLDGELHVVRIGSGKRVGTVDLGSAIAGTPVVWENTIYVPLTRSGNNLVAYDLLRGGVSWRVEIGDIETSPLLVENRMYVTSMQGELISVHRVDGMIEWRFHIPAAFKSIRSSPAADDRAIFFGADDGVLYAVRASSGTLLWKFQTHGSVVASPSVHGGKVFVGSSDKTFYCVDADSGRLVWKKDLGSAMYNAAAVSSDRLFLTTTDGRVICLDALSGNTFWTFRAEGVISSSPLLSGSVLYVGSLDKHLYALDALTGRLVWDQKFPSRIRTAPVVWNDYVILLLEDRTVVALKPEGGRPS